MQDNIVTIHSNHFYMFFSFQVTDTSLHYLRKIHGLQRTIKRGTLGWLSITKHCTISLKQ